MATGGPWEQVCSHRLKELTSCLGCLGLLCPQETWVRGAAHGLASLLVWLPGHAARARSSICGFVN